MRRAPGVRSSLDESRWASRTARLASGVVGLDVALLGACRDTVERSVDEADTTAGARDEVEFFGEESDVVSSLLTSARTADHSRRQSSGSALANAYIAFMNGVCSMACGVGEKLGGDFVEFWGGIDWL